MIRWGLLLGAVSLVCGCSELDYAPMTFSSDGTHIVAVGDIDGGTAGRFRQIRAAHPEARTLVLEYVGGSVNDQANLRFSRQVRSAGFKTVVPSGGLVASGGTDLFLAGVERTLQAGACVGVHSWSGGDGREGRFVPTDDPEHAEYVAFYQDLGIDPAFYWYTLAAAPSDGMHWMTLGEARRFGLTTEASGPLAVRSQCEFR